MLVESLSEVDLFVCTGNKHDYSAEIYVKSRSFQVLGIDSVGLGLLASVLDKESSVTLL